MVSRRPRALDAPFSFLAPICRSTKVTSSSPPIGASLVQMPAQSSLCTIEACHFFYYLNLRAGEYKSTTIKNIPPMPGRPNPSLFLPRPEAYLLAHSRGRAAAESNRRRRLVCDKGDQPKRIGVGGTWCGVHRGTTHWHGADDGSYFGAYGRQSWGAWSGGRGGRAGGARGGEGSLATALVDRRCK